MSASVTLLTLRTRLRALADLGSDTTSGRYPNARLNDLLNASIVRVREIACECGNGQLYLAQTSPATMTVGTLNANTSFGTIPFPTNVTAIYGVDVVFTSTDIRSLEYVPFRDRNQFHDIYGGLTGRPVGFCPLNIGTESTSTIAAGTIAIFPAPDRAYSYTLWYLPPFTALVNDTDVYNGVAGWEAWVIADSAMQIAGADNDAQNLLALARNERDKAELLITRRADSIQRTGPGRRCDVRGQTRRGRVLNWRRVN